MVSFTSVHLSICVQSDIAPKHILDYSGVKEWM